MRPTYDATTSKINTSTVKTNINKKNIEIWNGQKNQKVSDWTNIGMSVNLKIDHLKYKANKNYPGMTAHWIDEWICIPYH